MMPNLNAKSCNTKTIFISLVFCLLVGILFCGIFHFDNKYNNQGPYGNSGSISLKASDLEKAIFLIDGWKFTSSNDENTKSEYTYIGEYANLQHNAQNSPHGIGTYTLNLDYVGTAQNVAIYFPALFFDYEIFINDELISSGEGSNQTSFTLTEGSQTLLLKTTSHTGYYSGLYHPPVLGTPKIVSTMVYTHILIYSFATFGSLVLALFTFSLWLRQKDKFALWFGTLAIAFSLYLSYFFVRLLGCSFGEYWYLMQSLAFYILAFAVIKLANHNSSQTYKYAKIIEFSTLTFSAILLILATCIPLYANLIPLHGILTNLYYVMIFAIVAYLTLSSKANNLEQLFTKLACLAFGIALLYNIFASNLFEPIYALWQFEWCGLILVTLFSFAMISRNQRILAENIAYQENLEQMVATRTSELTDLLQERKAFFADMAHDLKAPVYATASFIDAIRNNATHLDSELMRYIDLVEDKQKEMAQRIQGLNDFNRMDGIADTPQPISVTDLLTRIQNSYTMATQVQMVYLVIEPPEQNATLHVPLDKIDILFENLIFNALKFTPPEGKITIAATVDEDGCHFILSDTGCGIAPDEIPYLFNRFYVGSRGKEKGGSGLGLYIVKSIVETLGGEISLSSKVGNGTTFFIDLPLKK